ncbi:hypothetical protein PLESTB_001656000 [Pleodorina starrii]|uniref:CRAL-TRIO domain-containing protein n=1 Tax=Pleodorina starrii TaxID=330485 RepID=A0A9W6BYL9_9CHLO|nr:hypothetical protein PLESTM_002006400 [Pleodorina starrii]GLC60669.1 hypothetical protein PLESTB_001656000 [Pleodorina starrii]GLC69665.1 hypothetical protein PLESTF_000862200 [Pleodorina starrii]
MALRQMLRKDTPGSSCTACPGRRWRSVHCPRRQTIKTCAVGPQLATSIPIAPGLRPEPWTNAPIQQNALAELQKRFSADAAPPDEATMKWYLRDRYFDVEEAEQKLRSMLKWRQTFQPQSTTPQMIAAEMASGKAYVHNCTDKYGRPAIVIRTKLHVTGQFPINDSKRLAAYLIDSAISRIPPGGEQIVGIFDLRGFTFAQNADFQFAAFMIEAFFEFYPRRVGQVLFVDAPWVFFPAWEVIKPLMRKYASLVRFLSVSELRSEFFTSETLPPDFK